MCDTLTYFKIEIYKSLYPEVSLYPGSISSVPISQLQPGNQDSQFLIHPARVPLCIFK